MEHTTLTLRLIPAAYAVLPQCVPAQEQDTPSTSPLPRIHACQPFPHHHHTQHPPQAGHSAWQAMCPTRVLIPAHHYRDRKFISNRVEKIFPEKNPSPLYPPSSHRLAVVIFTL